MLKKRIVATLLVKDGLVVQSIGFKRYLPVGQPAIAMEFLSHWGVDEIILLDISATKNNRQPDYNMVRSASINCRVPLVVGGGITEIEHVAELMHCGADKVALNQAALHQSSLITKVACQYGQQCVIASVDCLLTSAGYRVFDYIQNKVLDQVPSKLAKKLQQLGAGELLINSVDRDGSYLGFDLKLIQSVCKEVTAPVICSGGAGKAQHFIEVFQRTTVSAASAANYFHFTEHSVTTTKAQVNKLIPLRHETYFHYRDSHFGADGRILKKDDQKLEEMLFQKIEKELI